MLQNINYRYMNGTHALRNVNIRISKGELVAIMGRNGAGKTTLIRTLNGLIRPQEGNIYHNGKNIKEKSIAELSKKVGIIFQNPAHQLFSNTIDEELKFSLKNLNLNKDEIQNKIVDTLKKFNLEKYRDRSPLNLSGGEMKKLAIASILCRNPEILVFDEPTLGQDGKEIRFFIQLLQEELNQGKTVIIITHNVEFTLNYLPRTILMSEGRIIADGPTEKILRNSLLLEKAALISPQLFQFKNALQQIGIPSLEKVNSKNELIDILKDYLKPIKRNNVGG